MSIALILIGAGISCAGIWWIYPPAAVIAFGLVFQMPLILFVLGCFGIVTSAGLREKRRVSIVIAFVLAMFLTPPDPMSQLLMAVPLCLLYELSIWAVWLKEKAASRGSAS